MHGATQGSLNPSPTRSHSRANTSKLGQGITLSGMTRFAQIANRAQPRPACRPHSRRVGALTRDRALPDLCLGIVSGRLGHLDPWILTPFMVDTLKAPARPGLSLSLCASDRTQLVGGSGLSVREISFAGQSRRGVGFVNIGSCNC